MTNYLHDAIVNAELDDVIKTTEERIEQFPYSSTIRTSIYLQSILRLLILMVRMFLEYSRRR